MVLQLSNDRGQVMYYVSSPELYLLLSDNASIQKNFEFHSTYIFFLKHLSRFVIFSDEEDDPRPVEGRNQPGYQDQVNMLTINYCCATGRDSSWRFKIPKADVQAAAKDHFYDTVPMTEL